MPVLPAIRRFVARRPWVQWVAIFAIAIALMASVADAMARLEDERSAWGTSVVVWVASRDVEIGEPIAAGRRTVPESVRPRAAVGADRSPEGRPARRAIGAGEIVVGDDVSPPDDELALAPDGWLVAPVEESPRSGARAGDRVQVVSDGFVLADEAVVVGAVDGVTLVAVRPEIAPLLPAASGTGAISLVRVP